MQALVEFIHEENDQTTNEEKCVFFEKIKNVVKYINQQGIIHQDLRHVTYFFG